MKDPKFIYIVYKYDFTDQRIPGFTPQYVEFVTTSKKDANIRRKMLVMANICCDVLTFPFDVCHEYIFKNVTPGCLLNGHGLHYDELTRMVYDDQIKKNLNK
jgi:transaldolase